MFSIICVLGNQVCVLMLIQLYTLSPFPYQKHDYFQAKTVLEDSFMDISSSLKDCLVLKLLMKTHQILVMTWNRVTHSRNFNHYSPITSVPLFSERECNKPGKKQRYSKEIHIWSKPIRLLKQQDPSPPMGISPGIPC